MDINTQMICIQRDNQWDPIREIIHCKDCIWWDKDRSEECNNPNSICYRNGQCESSWYCPDGEKMKKRGEIK